MVYSVPEVQRTMCMDVKFVEIHEQLMPRFQGLDILAMVGKATVQHVGEVQNIGWFPERVIGGNAGRVSHGLGPIDS